ncbi:MULTISPECIES: hypothetical protein [Shewanella]|uniref:Uncharacterized protein n=1 Tax=Curvibacter phage P26059B TaxID=1983784 RepID=A0A384UH30_9CAUD|nr:MULTISPECIES: hypothetical protein [Shewanella]YP_009811778.1 hypothetical protein HOU10_gp16 [Curvibacter phage P26059B]ASJ79292.1 hypothetical protein P26059B_0016 [Curvibacter phage P26059B]RPA22533.1 hypothetical protein EGC78_21295 [Shewanella frigidimarina]RPA31704.1 hypothetical protein EGC79_20505 [Shewanella vesiculosa]
MTVRKAWQSDLPNLMKALVKFAHQVEVQPEHYAFAKGFNLATAYENLKDAITSYKCLYIHGYLVFFDGLDPWYGGGSVLQEWFTIRIEDGPVRAVSVVTELQVWAIDNGYSRVLGADSSPTGIMAKAYEANGFTPLTKQYFKEV